MQALSLSLIPLLLLVIPIRAVEESPVARFKEDLRKALAIRYDPELQVPEAADEQKRQIWALIDPAFDGELILPRILERTWPALNADERKQLYPVACHAIKWKFIGKLYKYNVEEIAFGEEGPESGQYKLKATLGTGRLRHSAEFLFLKKEDVWVAVDIRVRGLSLSSHYRRKFDNTYFKTGLTGLLEHLESEVSEEFEEMGFVP